MAISWGFWLAASLGNACLLIWLINVVHGLGINWRGMDRAVAVSLVLIGGTVAIGEWKAATAPVETWPSVGLAYAWFCVFLATVVLPVATFLRLLRRRPAQARPTAGAEIDFAAELGAETLIGSGRYSWCLRLPRHEAFRVSFDEFDLFLPGLPVEFEGLSIAHLTDFHFAPCFDPSFFDAVIERVARWDADVVAFTGDLIDDQSAIPWIRPIFSKLRGRSGNFAILGNHDVHQGPERIARELERAGFRMIDGLWTTIRREGCRLALGGTSAPWGPRLDWKARPGGLAAIVLSHSPDLFPQIAAEGIDLTLAGHNHGGQIRLPAIGPILMPSRYGRHFDADFFRRGRSLLFVGRGLAGKHPLRYGCPPQVARLTLRTESRSPTSASAEARAISARTEVG